MITAAAEPGRLGAAFEWLGIERAWTRTRGSPDVVIAIIDGGVQVDHPLLGPNIERDLSHVAMSANSHEIPGTHAAGVAAGRHSEVDRFSGVAPGSRILPVRFAANASAQALDLAHAIEYAVEMGASIINVAQGSPLETPAARRAIQYAATRNALVVCTASPGDSAPDDDSMPNLLSVLPVGDQAQPLPNYLLAPRAAHLAAPGFARVPHWQGAGHVAESAPALAAPYVSGCAALVKTQNPGWGYHEIKEHLLASATPHEQLKPHCRSSALLNVAHAVLGPLELAEPSKTLTWSSLNGAELRWTLRYRSALCAHAAALYRPHGDAHWRELAVARMSDLRMRIPGEALRHSSGLMRLACRDSNLHCDDIELTIQ